MDKCTYLSLKQKPKRPYNAVMVYQYGKCVYEAKSPALCKDFIKRNNLKNCDLMFVNV